MSKILLSINLVLSSVIVAWVSVAYFEYKKQSSKDSVLPSIDLTYSPIPPSFTAEQIQFNASYFVNADTIFAPKLFYLSLPPVSELSDNLLQLNLAAATSKITIENQNISLRASDLFSPWSHLLALPIAAARACRLPLQRAGTPALLARTSSAAPQNSSTG